MSRTYNHYLMQNYGDLEIGNAEEERIRDMERDYEYELYETGQDLILGITDNPPMEFYWNENLNPWKKH